MRFRLDRQRRRWLYVQHGPEPDDMRDLFVAWFQDEHMAVRVMRLLNAAEERELGAPDD